VSKDIGENNLILPLSTAQVPLCQVEIGSGEAEPTLMILNFVIHDVPYGDLGAQTGAERLVKRY
jgi:hypothetical protein